MASEAVRAEVYATSDDLQATFATPLHMGRRSVSNRKDFFSVAATAGNNALAILGQVRMSPNPFYRANPGFKRLYIFGAGAGAGAGGAGRGLAWLVRQSWDDQVEIVFVVDRPEFLVDNVHGYPVRLLSDIKPDESARYVISIAKPQQRCRIAPILDAIPLQATMLVHPRAEMSEYVELENGALICVGTIVSNESKVGAHCYVNANTMIGHDVTVGAYCTFSPNVNIAGHVVIGERVFFGLGANIINGSPEKPLVIGDDVYIAAGACVTKSVPSGAVMAGVPAVQKIMS